jgi:hypothetical protein
VTVLPQPTKPTRQPDGTFLNRDSIGLSGGNEDPRSAARAPAIVAGYGVSSFRGTTTRTSSTLVAVLAHAAPAHVLACDHPKVAMATNVAMVAVHAKPHSLAL